MNPLLRTCCQITSCAHGQGRCVPGGIGARRDGVGAPVTDRLARGDFAAEPVARWQHGDAGEVALTEVRDAAAAGGMYQRTVTQRFGQHYAHRHGPRGFGVAVRVRVDPGQRHLVRVGAGDQPRVVPAGFPADGGDDSPVGADQHRGDRE